MKSQPNSHTHCQAAQASAQTKAWQRVCLTHPDKIELKKSSLPSENKKYPNAQPDTTKTKNRSIDNGLQRRWTEGQLITHVSRQLALTFSVLAFRLRKFFILARQINIPQSPTAAGMGTLWVIPKNSNLKLKLN